VILPASYADLIAFYSAAVPVPLYRAVENGTTVAVGGLVRRDGRLWAFLDVHAGISPRVGLGILRKLREGLSTANEDTFITCDEATYPEAPRLLRALGFEVTQEIRDNMRVYACRVSNS
jgi:hypothetical protein